MDPSPPGYGRLGRRFVVSGRVQGVGFRYFVLRRAQALSLTGWVRNLPSGAVEVSAWGAKGAVGKLAELLAIGPRSAKVTNVEITEISDGDSSPSGFQVIS